jgi:hypothetical protein
MSDQEGPGSPLPDGQQLTLDIIETFLNEDHRFARRWRKLENRKPGRRKVWLRRLGAVVLGALVLAGIMFAFACVIHLFIDSVNSLQFTIPPTGYPR